MNDRRWNATTKDYGTSPKVDAFLDDIVAVCRKHNMSLGHEDSHGAFLVEDYSEENVRWLNAADDMRKDGGT